MRHLLVSPKDGTTVPGDPELYTVDLMIHEQRREFLLLVVTLNVLGYSVENHLDYLAQFYKQNTGIEDRDGHTGMFTVANAKCETEIMGNFRSFESALQGVHTVLLPPQHAGDTRSQHEYLRDHLHMTAPEEAHRYAYQVKMAH